MPGDVRFNTLASPFGAESCTRRFGRGRGCKWDSDTHQSLYGTKKVGVNPVRDVRRLLMPEVAYTKSLLSAVEMIRGQLCVSISPKYRSSTWTTDT
ncbi:hypothetical protein TNIN_134701 [Trichonephila inaurata madagascariensis]|uniref:Uncharacterized protein n=1 Tax=Trichonephila inaurata madagascariensis TaxID=2747483 RepID=A0A8X6YNE8_9ARAC|nr:hypothetical protein TNIN_134701 [Trichonephila inaurata madagascariensis]